jgi:predicted component of type VI protein secretion system
MYLYNGITDFTSEQIMAEIRNCVSKWEPRVNIIKVINMSDINDTENNTIRLDIIYTIPSLDDN